MLRHYRLTFLLAASCTVSSVETLSGNHKVLDSFGLVLQ